MARTYRKMNRHNYELNLTNKKLGYDYELYPKAVHGDKVLIADGKSYGSTYANDFTITPNGDIQVGYRDCWKLTHKAFNKNHASRLRRRAGRDIIRKTIDNYDN